MEKTQKMITAGITAGCLLLAGSIGVSAASLVQMNSLKASVEQVIATSSSASEEHATAEDGVQIMDGEYTIESTTAISDAYISGDTSKLDDRQKETLDMAKAVLDEIITDGMSDYEKEKAVYDWMTQKLGNDTGLMTVVPTSDADSDNPYGVLKYHKAVCVGYATTFRLFMQMMGMECHVIHNSALYHTWDIVKIDDDWYHVDIYYDAGTGNYAHFNLTDAMMAQDDREWDTDFFPNATSLKYNIAYQNCIECDDVYGLAAGMREAIDEKLTNCCFSFKTQIDDETAAIGTQIISSIDSSMQMNYTGAVDSKVPYMIASSGWQKDPSGDNYIMMVTFQWSMDDSAATFDDETTESINDALTSAFSDILPGISSSDSISYDYSETGDYVETDDYSETAGEEAADYDAAEVGDAG